MLETSQPCICSPRKPYPANIASFHISNSMSINFPHCYSILLIYYFLNFVLTPTYDTSIYNLKNTTKWHHTMQHKQQLFPIIILLNKNI